MSKEIIVERGTKTVYREGSKIVKQFKAGYPKSAVIKEAFNHALAEESGLNVPALLEVKNTGEGWALVIEAVRACLLSLRRVAAAFAAVLLRHCRVGPNLDNLGRRYVDLLKGCFEGAAFRVLGRGVESEACYDEVADAVPAGVGYNVAALPHVL